MSNAERLRRERVKVSAIRANLRAVSVAMTLAAAATAVVGAPTSSAGAEGGSTDRRLSEASLVRPGAAARAPTASTATLVRETLLSQLSPSAPDSSGIAYRSDVDRLLVADSEVNEMPIFEGVNLWEISRQGTKQYDTGTTLEFSKEPTGIAYDRVGERVFISDDDAGRVFEVTAGSDDRFGTSDDAVTSFSVRAFGNDDAEDVAYDSTSGDLFVAEGNVQEVWRVSAGPNGRFDGVPPTGDDTVGHFDVGVYGSIDVQGITYSPVRNSLFLADRMSNQVVEVSKAGALIQTIDVTAIDMHRPAGITLAPASDNSAGTSIYIVARGRDNNTYPNENDGAMYELSAPDLGPIVPPPNQAPSVSAGPDRAVMLPTSAILKGKVTDDGLPDPPGSVTVTWSKVNGPGAVTFAHPHLAASTAGFSAAGTYVLRLSASDSALTVSDSLKVVVSGKSPANLTCQGSSALVQIGPSTNDHLLGTNAIDLIKGKKGNDVVLGRGDADCLEGGAGKDTLRGQGGKDVLRGNGGRDVLLGAADADRLNPGTGKDKVVGGGGNDRIDSVDGSRDVVSCGRGVDRAMADSHDQVAKSCEWVVLS
jgi:Ca2+-binding RTX toxin-like protein